MRCPYCNRRPFLVTGEAIYPHRPALYHLKFWQCAPCDAYVGCHAPDKGYGDGTRPLGRLANAELRAAKRAAHAAIDPYWRMGRLRRNEVYAILAVWMGLEKGKAHIGEFDIEQCKRATEIGNNEALWRSNIPGC